MDVNKRAPVIRRCRPAVRHRQYCPVRPDARVPLVISGTFEPGGSLAPMQYNEILARRVVAEIAPSSGDGGALQPVMLHEVARRLKIDEASAESAKYRAVAERWPVFLFHIPDAADGGRSLCRRRGSDYFRPWTIDCATLSPR